MLQAIRRIQAMRDEVGRAMIAEPVAQEIAQQLREDMRKQTPPAEYRDCYFDLVTAAQEAISLMSEKHLDELWELVSDDYWETADSEDHEAYDAAQGEIGAFDRALEVLREIEPAAMAITFAGEAYESYQAWVELGIGSLGPAVGRNARYFVQVTESDTGETFDAWLIGIDREAEMGNTVKLVRNDDDGSTDPDLTKVESIEAERIHVY